MNTAKLAAGEVREFLFGRSLDCFHPDTKAKAATIEYLANGTCKAAMVDGASDEGRYGFERDMYWTQYSWFRDGGLFRFYLERVDDSTCQAYFEDGGKAFIQTIKT